MRRWIRTVDAVPAWVGLAAGWIVIVGGWALVAPDDKHAPWGPTLLGILCVAPAIRRAAVLPWWRGLAFVAVLVVANFVTALIGPLWMWLIVALALTVPLTWALLDEPWRARPLPPPRGGWDRPERP